MGFSSRSSGFSGDVVFGYSVNYAILAFKNTGYDNIIYLSKEL
jgi:hypothetical protein